MSSSAGRAVRPVLGAEPVHRRGGRSSAAAAGPSDATSSPSAHGHGWATRLAPLRRSTARSSSSPRCCAIDCGHRRFSPGVRSRARPPACRRPTCDDHRLAADRHSAAPHRGTSRRGFLVRRTPRDGGPTAATYGRVADARSTARTTCRTTRRNLFQRLIATAQWFHRTHPGCALELIPLIPGDVGRSAPPRLQLVSPPVDTSMPVPDITGVAFTGTEAFTFIKERGTPVPPTPSDLRKAASIERRARGSSGEEITGIGADLAASHSTRPPPPSCRSSSGEHLWVNNPSSPYTDAPGRPWSGSPYSSVMPVEVAEAHQRVDEQVLDTGHPCVGVYRSRVLKLRVRPARRRAFPFP
jgi:hypothetical protein